MARHALYHCPRVFPVLKQLVKTIGTREGSMFDLTETQYILGVVTAPSCSLTELVETIMGLARLYIVDFRYKQANPEAPQIDALLIFVSNKLNLLYKTTDEEKKQKILLTLPEMAISHFSKICR